MSLLGPVFQTWSLLKNSAGIYQPCRRNLIVQDGVEAADNYDRTMLYLRQDFLSPQSANGKPSAPAAGKSLLYARKDVPLLRSSTANGDWQLAINNCYLYDNAWNVTVPAGGFATRLIGAGTSKIDPGMSVFASSEVTNTPGILLNVCVYSWNSVRLTLYNRTASPVSFSPVPLVKICAFSRFSQTARIPMVIDYTSGTVKRSRYLGEVWETCGGSPGTGYAFAVWAGDRFFAFKADGTVKMTEDYSESWSDVTPLNVPGIEWRDACCFDDRVFVVSYDDGLTFYTDDLANSWYSGGDTSAASSCSRIATVETDSGIRLVTMGLSSGDTLISDDNGAIWTPGGSAGSGTRRWLRGIGRRLVTITQLGTVAVSDDGSASWRNIASIGSGDWNAGCMVDGRLIAIDQNAGTLKLSEDTGETWTTPLTLGAGDWRTVA
jgi:hypothetical protein